MVTNVANIRDLPSLLTIAQVAERLVLNEWTVRKMLRSGELKAYKIRNRWRVKLSDLDEFIEQGSNK